MSSATATIFDDEHGVEVALGIVERAVRDRELHAGEDSDRHRAPAEQPPTSTQCADRLRPGLTRQSPGVGDGDEDEDDRAADPHGGGQHVEGKERHVHGPARLS